MKFKDLKFPFLDAEQYLNNEINKVFCKGEEYEKIMMPQTYFIIGPKGSGKTMYANYFCNNIIQNSSDNNEKIKSKIFRIESDIYKKIISLNQNGVAEFSFKKLWQIHIIRELCNELINKEDLKHKSHKTLETLQKECDLDFEIPNSYSEDNSKNSGIIGNVNSSNSKVSASSEKSTNKKVEGVIIDEGINKEYKKFVNDLSDLKCNKYLYLFIDGIDSYTIPETLDRKFYMDCINDLATSVLELNRELNRKGNRKIKIILLCRDDIYEEVDICNNKSTLSDNIVDLNYSYTNLNTPKSTKIYKFANSLFKKISNDENDWNSYFGNFKITRFKNSEPYDIISYMIRLTTGKPREFVKIFELLQECCKSSDKNNPTSDMFSDTSFEQDYSNFYLQSVQDQMKFFVPEIIVKAIFSTLTDANLNLTFYFSEFEHIFKKIKEGSEFYNYFKDRKDILMLLYRCNCICINIKNENERDGFEHWWFFRKENGGIKFDKNRIDNDTTFTFHWGLEKKLCKKGISAA
ncbi:MAG: hypothetical protein LBL93_07135 [Ruminococcus sp.]|jgi:hypothetical protein|nr:hypothetical protein [Ruminococcus sp.]